MNRPGDMDGGCDCRPRETVGGCGGGGQNFRESNEGPVAAKATAFLQFLFGLNIDRCTVL